MPTPRTLFANVLVPFDFTTPSEHALRTAGTLAAQAKGRVTVLHVITPFYPMPDVVYGGELLDARAMQARILERLEARVGSLLGAVATCRVVVGNAGVRIVEAARDATCIVMSTHGRTGAAHALVGSVAERVVRLAHVPVLVLPAARRADAVPPLRAGRTRRGRH
jgi:nucleotide-binding universal stress UspA family protein